MATPTSSKRFMILSLAELQKYPTTNALYEITLPFNNAENPFDNPLECSCPKQRPGGRSRAVCQGCDLSVSFAKVKAKAIKQTEKRWVWFSEARNLDDRLGRRLGTLGFLPLEIREKIWCAAIENYKDTFKRNYMKQSNAFWNGRETWLKERLDFQPPHGHYSRPPGTFTRLDIFNIQSYSLTNRGWNYEGTIHLRYASPEAKVELENTFVFTNAFRFYCPRALDYFLDQLSEYQGSLLRSIAIKVFGCFDCDYHDDGSARPSMKSKCRAWLAIIERLPASLKFVTFELGRCGISLAVEYSCEERQPNQIQSMNTVVDLLELMTKKVQRQAPRAKINMTGLEERCEEDRDILQTMLDEITPYSEDFKKWSEQSRKNGMGHRKEL